jgi:hypothetical protein
VLTFRSAQALEASAHAAGASPQVVEPHDKRRREGVPGEGSAAYGTAGLGEAPAHAAYQAPAPPAIDPSALRQSIAGLGIEDEALADLLSSWYYRYGCPVFVVGRGRLRGVVGGVTTHRGLVCMAVGTIPDGTRLFRSSSTFSHRMQQDRSCFRRGGGRSSSSDLGNRAERLDKSV